ncbi:MAG: hypothetical protein ABFS05_12680 [Bacteroidota bacterium]
MRDPIKPWKKLIELAILLSFIGLFLSLYMHGYLDKIIGNDLTVWFFAIIALIVVLVETLAFFSYDVDVHFWSWLTTGFGMLGTVLGFSLALAGIEVQSLQDPSVLSSEIGTFLKTVSFAIDTTLIGLAAAMILESTDKIREILYRQPQPVNEVQNEGEED